LEPAIDIWEKQLKFEVSMRLNDDKTGKLTMAAFNHGDAIFMAGVADDPEDVQMAGKGITLFISVDDDIDGFYESVRHGEDLEVVDEIADQFWGDRTFTIRDSLGFTWMFGQHISDQIDVPDGYSMEMAGAPQS
ncbi:MAG: VOC family protein, partial [Chloroflexota bacterium]